LITVKGSIDGKTRCKHYHSEKDIIAVKLNCCGQYYGCYYCHAESTDHPAQVWPRSEWNSKAVLCGNCSSELTIEAYLNCNYECPVCTASFNPGCKNHYHLYFEWPDSNQSAT
jgi:uncharacterized CHY-type Zn-finger protein